jgi:hypothetical protein
MRVRQGQAMRSKGSDMFTKDARTEFPAAQNFHPEFGYFCPSARIRRKVRSAGMTLLVGMVIAAGTALALAPQVVSLPPDEGGREETALPTAAALPPIGEAVFGRGMFDRSMFDKVSFDRALFDKAMPVAAALSMMPVTYPPTSSRAQVSCDDLSGSFLVLQCQSGKAGKSHLTREARVAHAASRRVATIPIGRIDAAPATEQHNPVAPRPAPAAETAPAVVATNVAAAAPPPEKPALVKKLVKPVPKPSRNDAGADALAAAPSPGFSLLSFFRDSLRTVRMLNVTR